jgi:AICAR transformylase/IMP cyclohydrolase PurH
MRFRTVLDPSLNQSNDDTSIGDTSDRYIHERQITERQITDCWFAYSV